MKDKPSRIVNHHVYAGKGRSGTFVVGVDNRAYPSFATNALEAALSLDDVKRLTALCLDFLAETQDPKGGKQALLIGGPLHGTWRIVEGPELSVPEMKRPPTLATDQQPPYTLNYQTHVYRQASDIGFLGYKLPFAIYEHESLWDANKTRAAEAAERELNEAKERHNKAKDELQKADSGLLRLQLKRDKLRFEYGV